MRLHRYLAAGCAAAAMTVIALAAAAGAATTRAPVIHEKFTPLACPSRPRTTIQLEGCAEQRVLVTDRTIDKLNARVFARLRKAGLAAFVVANSDWIKYRDAACTGEASIYRGGSVQPVAYANCLVSIGGSHVSELRRMLVALSAAG